MRKLIVTAFLSLDGVMQAPGGPEEDTSGGFAHGGWLANSWDDQLGEIKSEEFDVSFDLLLGRRTSTSPRTGRTIGRRLTGSR